MNRLYEYILGGDGKKSIYGPTPMGGGGVCVCGV